MQNKMLQVRHRYLQARRNLEYDKLRDEEARAALDKRIKLELELKSIKEEITVTATLECDKCKMKFVDKRGLSSHVRHKSCEET